jgi:hypothetical protein
MGGIMKTETFDTFWRANKADLVQLLKSLKPTIGSGYRADDSETLPSMSITISVNDDCTEWSCQTGDNSYTGGCYSHRYWGVGTLYRRSNSAKLASELIDSLADAIGWE